VTRARFRFTTAADGNLSILQDDADSLATRRRAVVDLPWTWLRQVHGPDVVVVDTPGGGSGLAADAAVTAVPGAALAVQTADCAPVALLSPDDEGVVGVAHAGWRGLEQGVLPAAVAAMRSLGASDVRAVLGPCIHAECYEFGAEPLATLVDRFGPGVRGTTAAGTPALDVPAAVRASLAAAGVDHVDDVDVCTACDTGYFSHRARADDGRQAVVVWVEPPA
jgi:YfiH family protein